jgi:hypothetical protein
VASHKEINARHFIPDPFLFYTLRQTKSLSCYNKRLTSLIHEGASHKEINARHFIPDPFLFYTLRQTKSLSCYNKRLTSLIPEGASHKEINARHFIPDPFLFYTGRQTKSLSCYKTKNAPLSGSINFSAERKGFEPSICCHIHAFQACAFSHSATSLFLFKVAKNTKKTDLEK